MIVIILKFIIYVGREGDIVITRPARKKKTSYTIAFELTVFFFV